LSDVFNCTEIAQRISHTFKYSWIAEQGAGGSSFVFVIYMYPPNLLKVKIKKSIG